MDADRGDAEVPSSSALSLASALNSTQARLDPVLRRLYERLESRAPKYDLVETIHACHAIKKRLQGHGSEGAPIAPPLFVYTILLRKLSIGGKVDMCKEVKEDMQAVGLKVGIETMNWILMAAVKNGQVEGIEEVLSDIASLHDDVDDLSSTAEDVEREDDVTEASSSAPLLSTTWTKNWTPTTYQHLITHCQQSHNLEYALALLGSASHRGYDEGNDSNFLTLVLSPTTVVDLLFLVTHCREARLAAELAQWIDDGIGARRLSAQSWMTVLRCCADLNWFPGTEVAWEGAVVKGLLVPDEGLFNQILVTAGRARQSDFVQSVLNYRKARSKTPFHEWHLMPLFEAQCANHDFVHALLTLTHASRLASRPLSDFATSPLVRAASESMENLNMACEALIQVGRDTTPAGGVYIGALNGLINAATNLGAHSMALQIYRTRHFLRSESSKPDCPMPSMFEGEKVGADHGDDLAKATQAMERDDGVSSATDHALQPNIDTFNALLTVALATKSHTMATTIFKQLNAHKVKANERTYERAIRLSLLQDNYQNAFRLLEECKKRDLVPTRWSYFYIGLRCLEENDPRWIQIGKEMLETGYNPGHTLGRKLREGGYIANDEL